MRREAHFVKNRYGRVGSGKKWYDEYHYALLYEEWAKKSRRISDYWARVIITEAADIIYIIIS